MKLIIYLNKAHAFPEGTERIHGGRRVRKIRGKWVYVSEGKHNKKEDSLESIIKSKYDWIFKVTNNKFEAGVILDNIGKEVFNKLGEEFMIDFTNEKDLMKDKILLHNHPKNAGFSPNDILLSFRARLKEIRAVTEKHEYIFRPDYTLRRQPMEDMNIYLIYENHDIFRDQKTLVELEKITVEEAQMNHWHFLAQRFVEKYGGHYERIER